MFPSLFRSALLFLVLGCAALRAAPVILPYSEDFSTGAGAFTRMTGTWSATGGVYRNTVSSGNGVATVEAGQLGGDPLTAPGFFMSAKFTVTSNGHPGNTFGLALLGTDPSFSGGVSNPYYLVDVKPGMNTLRVLRVGINNTAFLPDTRLQNFTLNQALPFTLEVLGTYENGVLRMDVTIRQGSASERFIAVDSNPLTTRYFGLRNRSNGGAFSVDCDDFTLRRISRVAFSAPPASFARPGASYTSDVAAISSTGVPVTLSAPSLPSWLTFTPGANGTGRLSGTPLAADHGAHTVTLVATDTEGGIARQEFNVSVLDPAGVFISEFLASNESGLKDEDGDQPDWIELFNSNSFPVDISGWWLSDNPLTSRKWALPSGTTIPAYGFLVVFASDKNRVTDPARLHTNFKLTSTAGGYLSLASADGTIVSAFVNYPAQRADRSFGAYGSYTPRGYLLAPSPGRPNNPVGYAGFVADPVFSVQRGFFTAPQNVVLSSATPGATLVYTLDGSTPTLSRGTRVPAPDAATPPQVTLSIASSTVLRAAAFAPGLAPSGAGTQTYLFLDDVITQSANGLPPSGWPTGRVNGQRLDYGMDPDVTSTVTAQQMKQALGALPTLSLVTDLPNLFDQELGIYVNPYGREEGYERPVSVELMNPDGTPGFHIDAGLRIRGGASRVATNPKHNFHLYFRGEYGATKLRFPLFGDEGADEFDRVDLRATQVKSWHNGDSGATYNRDEWSRYTHAAMGHAYTRSRYYHLYLNGQYWGIYGTQERADSDWASSYFGGKKADYDVLKTYVIPHRVEAADGDNVAWAQLHSAAVAGFANDRDYFAVQGLDANGLPSPTLKPLVDVDNLIDYTLLNFYIGNGDGPVNTAVGVPKNFFAFRPRDGRFGFRFVAHDCEDAMNNTDVTGDISAGTTLEYFNPRWLSQRLATNAKYRQRFADRVQRHLFGGGALDNSVALARWRYFRNQISTAILGESARWGDASGSLRTVSHWNSANNNIEANFIPVRRDALIYQLRLRGLYPTFDAPSFSQQGGIIPPGYALTITASAGTAIYYTLDGTDPMSAGARTYTSPVPLDGVQTTVKARARNTSTNEWSALTEALFTLDAIPAVAGNLSISEIHYNPPGSSDDVEFVELVNTSGRRLDLTGVNFTGAMVFTFGSLTLEPGERVLVVEDEAAFRAVYGTDPFVAGQWSGALNNSGDSIILRDRSGFGIEQVTYADLPPWPTSADGDGYTLVRISPSTYADDALNWRASVAPGGNPGATDTERLAAWLIEHQVGDALASGADGIPALIKFATGLDISGEPLPNVALTPEPENNPPTMLVTFRRRIAADDVTVELQTSSDMISWQTLVPGAPGAPIVFRQTHGDGTESLTVRTAAADAAFARLRVTAR